MLIGIDASRIQMRHVGVLEEEASALCCCALRTTATKSIGGDNDAVDDVRLRVASSTACQIVYGFVVPWNDDGVAAAAAASRPTGAVATVRFKLIA